MTHFQRSTIDRVDLEAVLAFHYGPSCPDPTAVEDARLRTFTLYLYTAPALCYATGQPIISAEVLAALEGKSAQQAARNYCGERFLREYRQRVDPMFQWEAHDWQGGKARRVRRATLDLQLLERIRTKPVSSMTKRVYITDGTAFSRKKQRAERERMLAEAEATRDYAVCRIQQDVMDYMNARSADLFTRAYRQYAPAAYNLADDLYRSGRLTPAAYASALASLRAMADQALPFYSCSARMKTARVFPAHVGLLTLRTDIANVIRRDWVTYDLVSSQTAINAVRWGAEETVAFLFEHLESDGALWRRWFEHLGHDYDQLLADDPFAFKQVKKALKIANYATQFGMRVKNVVRGLNEKLGKGKGKRMLCEPLFEEIITCREEALMRIEEDGGAEDCFGNWIQIEPGQDARSVSAQLAQNQELALLYPVVELAKDTDQFQIAIWQHDGLDIAYRDARRVDTWEGRIISAVDETCRELGIPTRLSRDKT